MSINSGIKTKKGAIGFVLTQPPKYSETFFNNKIKGLQENDFEVILFVEKKTNDIKLSNIKIITAPNFSKNTINKLVLSIVILFKSLLTIPKISWVFYKLERADGYSVFQSFKSLIINQHILAHKLEWLHFGFGMLAVGRENIANAIGAKMGVSFRGFDLYLSPLKHPNCYKYLFTKDVRYHLLSQTMKKTLLNYGVKSKNIVVIPPAINVAFFKPKIKTQSSTIKLITVGRLHWKKGLEYTLQALAILHEDQIDFHYTIIGEGDQLERLVYATHQLGISNKVSFTGKIPHSEVKNYLQKSDIYIQYSVQEGFCNSVLEAQSMGLLCVVSNADGLDENVLNNSTGWVIEKRNPEALAKKILEVIKLPNIEKQKVKNLAIRRVKRHFSLEIQKKAFLNFYKT